MGFNDYRKDSASKFRLLSDEEKESYGSTEDILSYINEIDAEGKSVNIKDGNKRKVQCK
ncbi:hypothetical protein [Shewanella marina]|uniref:hypothetical protein n=1 Tax=Shewanella marina TaxID=487319 RepID=UPI000A433C24|nr:hypothetical protein [Shewanella marina]